MNDRLSGLLQCGIVDRLVGVVDLKNGQAVHAVAGIRRHYAPLTYGSTIIDGDAVSLVSHYHQLGLSRLYIADLDGIESQSHQLDLIRQLVSVHHDWQEILIDIGWTGDEGKSVTSAIGRLATDFPAIRLIVATESANSIESLGRLAPTIQRERTILGMDYRGGRLISDVADEEAWIDSARRYQLGGVLMLDLESVGTSRGAATLKTCERVRQRIPEAVLYSGGGIRSAADVHQLTDAGCDRCLVATALLR